MNMSRKTLGEPVNLFGEAEPIIGEVYALRQFVLEDGVLTGISFRQVIYPGINRAKCAFFSRERKKEDHIAPEVDCSCGWYSFNEDRRWTNEFFPDVVTAVVKLSGKVVTLEKGFRAENMEIVARTQSRMEKKEFKNNLLDQDLVYGIPIFKNYSAMLKEFPLSDFNTPKIKQKPLNQMLIALCALIQLFLVLGNNVVFNFGDFNLITKATFAYSAILILTLIFQKSKLKKFMDKTSTHLFLAGVFTILLAIEAPLMNLIITLGISAFIFLILWIGFKHLLSSRIPIATTRNPPVLIENSTEEMDSLVRLIKTLQNLGRMPNQTFLMLFENCLFTARNQILTNEVAHLKEEINEMKLQNDE